MFIRFGLGLGLGLEGSGLGLGLGCWWTCYKSDVYSSNVPKMLTA